MKTFNFYQTIDDAKYDGNTLYCFYDMVKISIERKYYYYSDNEKTYIEEEKESSIIDNKTYFLKDPNYDWDEKEINLECRLKIDNSFRLFGENGLVYHDAIIGVGLEWKPDKSRIKRCKKIARISWDSKEINVPIDINLDDLKSDIDFKLKMYIEKPGELDGDCTFANKEGLVFFDYQFLKLKFTGSASVFPINEFSDKNDILWKVQTNYSDVYDDEFNDENLCIYINKAHKSYDFIQENNVNYNHDFLVEVLSNSLSSLLYKILEQEDFEIDFDRASDDGSIAQALRYFRDDLNFDFNNGYISLLESIKKFFDKEYKK